jgi:predicted extracellular nuclease
MKRAGVWLVIGMVMSTLVAACGDNEKVSDVRFADVRKAEDGGPEALRSYVDKIRGKKVRWSGVVTESVREHGDDYIEIGYLLVDLDTAGQGSPAADVIFEIKPSQIDEFQPGDGVTVVGVVREFERRGDATLLKLEMKELDKTKKSG